jgi:hypothetical protein
MIAARMVLAALLVSLGLIVAKAGVYGWTLFVIGPALLGALTVSFVRPPSSGKAAQTGMWAAITGSLLFLLAGAEGLICIVMALPLNVGLGALGGWLAYEAEHRDVSREQILPLLLLLPTGGLYYDTNAKPDMLEVRTAIEINAAPEQVWKHVVAFPELPPPTEWFFRAGIAYPIKARIEGTALGAVRYCEFSTGAFVEPIEEWEEPRLLRFRVTKNPAPMKEWSPYPGVDPAHLSGYMISERGQFKLTALPGGRTSLEGTTWYRHGLWPSTYWRWWSDAIIHRIHLRVLRHIARLSE